MMATATATETKKATYPSMSTYTWWTLRKKFQDWIPTTADGNYLAAVLGYKDAASTLQITRPLRRMGLIDDVGKPTPLARRWSDDEEYPKVCEEIRQAMYPGGLLDAFSDKEADRVSVERWFALNTGAAAKTAKSVAGFYLSLQFNQHQEANAGYPVGSVGSCVAG